MPACLHFTDVACLCADCSKAEPAALATMCMTYAFKHEEMHSSLQISHGRQYLLVLFVVTVG